MDSKILKGVGAQIVIWTFYDQVVKVGERWVEQEILRLIAKWSSKAESIVENSAQGLYC